jgi:hypothetical protein
LDIKCRISGIYTTRVEGDSACNENPQTYYIKLLKNKKMKKLKMTKPDVVSEKNLLAGAQNFVKNNAEERPEEWGCLFGDGYVLVYK